MAETTAELTELDKVTSVVDAMVKTLTPGCIPTTTFVTVAIGTPSPATAKVYVSRGQEIFEGWCLCLTTELTRLNGIYTMSKLTSACKV